MKKVGRPTSRLKNNIIKLRATEELISTLDSLTNNRSQLITDLIEFAKKVSDLTESEIASDPRTSQILIGELKLVLTKASLTPKQQEMTEKILQAIGEAVPKFDFGPDLGEVELKGLLSELSEKTGMDIVPGAPGTLIVLPPKTPDHIKVRWEEKLDEQYQSITGSLPAPRTTE